MRKKYFFIVAGIFIVVILLVKFNFFKNEEKKEVCFSSKCVEVEIADEESERTRGLMFRTSLDENKGMLFVFDKSENYPFWMKNTLIPLNIIWIGENFKIVYIANAVPCREEPCEIYNPQKNAKYVVEVNEGFVEENGVEVGDEVEIR